MLKTMIKTAKVAYITVCVASLVLPLVGLFSVVIGFSSGVWG